MKVSKINGLGNKGIRIDGLKKKDLSEDLWKEIGERHLSSLVTLITNIDFDKQDFWEYIFKWGSIRNSSTFNLSQKYNCSPTEIADVISKEYRQKKRLGTLTKEDQNDFDFIMSALRTTDKETKNYVTYISGEKDSKGRPKGMFNEGELGWHSNEAGRLEFTPAVALLGVHGMKQSATCFLDTSTYYEEIDESFRSELDELIAVHKFIPGKISPKLIDEQDAILKYNMCPYPDGNRIPLVIKSPYGIKGLHYSVNTIDHFEGMSREESDKLMNKLTKELFVEKYQYDHWYENENDLLLFDNSITLHRRLGETTNRLAYRIQYDYDKLVEHYNPYFQEEFYNKTEDILKDMFNLKNGIH